MKTLLILSVVAALATGCAGPGGPAEQTGRSIDHGAQKVGDSVEHGAQKVGEGVEKTGEKIQEAVH